MVSNPKGRVRSLSAVDSRYAIVMTDDGSRTLYSDDDNETFHSESGALSESKLVFMQNSGVQSRLQEKTKTRVLEIGFGAGLNFFLTASCALNHCVELEYVAFESRVLPVELIVELGYDQIVNDEFARASLLQLYQESIKRDVGLTGQFSCVELAMISKPFEVEENHFFECFDAVYFDAFSPQANPDLWTEKVFRHLRSLLKTNGRLVTYCVKSNVQRLIRAAGFKVTKTAGPIGGKREVLIAENVDV